MQGVPAPLPPPRPQPIWRATMVHHFITFASDAALLALAGLGFALLAAFAMVAERRRLRRARIDSVGWVPWMPIFVASAVIAGGMLAMAVPALLKG